MAHYGMYESNIIEEMWRHEQPLLQHMFANYNRTYLFVCICVSDCVCIVSPLGVQIGGEWWMSFCAAHCGIHCKVRLVWQILLTYTHMQQHHQWVLECNHRKVISAKWRTKRKISILFCNLPQCGFLTYAGMCHFVWVPRTIDALSVCPHAANIIYSSCSDLMRSNANWCAEIYFYRLEFNSLETTLLQTLKWAWA